MRGPVDLAGVPVGWPITPQPPCSEPVHRGVPSVFREVLDATFMIGFLMTGPDTTQAWTAVSSPPSPKPAPYDEAVLS